MAWAWAIELSEAFYNVERDAGSAASIWKWVYLLPYSVSRTMVFWPLTTTHARTGRSRRYVGHIPILVTFQSWKRSSSPQMTRAQNTHADQQARFCENDMTAFLHVAAISTALGLRKQDKPAEQRSGIAAAPVSFNAQNE